MGFPGGSDGKESAYNVWDPGSIPGSGRPPGEGTGYALQCSCLENPRDRGAWWAAIYGVAQSRTRLKRLSSSSSSILACRITRTEEPGGLAFMGSKRVGHNWATNRHNPNRGVPPHDLPRTSPPNTITLGVKVSHMNFGVTNIHNSIPRASHRPGPFPKIKRWMVPPGVVQWGGP